MKRETCPYLGLKDDPTTVLNFPSQGNFCHQARPVSGVKGTYQEKYCLTENHVTCPLYNAAHPVPLPRALAVKSGPVFTGRQVVALVGVPIMVAAVAALAYGWNAFGKQVYNKRSVPNTGADTGEADFGLVGAPAKPNLTPFSVNPLSDTAVTPTANCPRPTDWVTYTVNPTDSLFRLSVIYGVSVENLQKANCMGNKTVILPGQVIYVPFIPTNTPIQVNTPVPQVILPKATNTFTQTPPPAATVTQVPPTSHTPTNTALPPSSTPAPTVTATSLPPTATSVPLPTATTPPPPPPTATIPPLPTNTVPPAPTTPPLPTNTVPPAPTTPPLSTNTVAPAPTTPPPTSTPLPPPTATNPPPPTVTVQTQPTNQRPPLATVTSQPLPTATSPVPAPTSQPAPTATALIIPSATAITLPKTTKTTKPKKFKP